jgi:ATP-dependent helicase/nuclease subunit B
LPLYALAVQELLMIDRRAVPWRVGYWFLKEKGFDAHGLPQFFERAEVGLRETADWHTLRGTLLNRVASLVRGIRSGNFPVFNLDEQCTSRCPYRTVCRIGQIRSLDKTWSAATANSSELTAASPAALAEAQT